MDKEDIWWESVPWTAEIQEHHGKTYKTSAQVQLIIGQGQVQVTEEAQRLLQGRGQLLMIKSEADQEPMLQVQLNGEPVPMMVDTEVTYTCLQSQVSTPRHPNDSPSTKE